MQFELTKEFISDLSEAIAAEDRIRIAEYLTGLHPVDIAEILDNLEVPEARFIYDDLKEEVASDVLVEMEEDVREDFLASLTAKEIAEAVDDMESDDATDLIQDLPEHRKERVIAEIKDQELASDIVSLLSYDEDTAGGLMAKEFFCVKKDWTVAKAIAEMRIQAEDTNNVFTVYVVDVKGELLGTLSLKTFLFANNSTTIEDLYVPNPRFVTSDTDAEEVADLMDKYDLVAIPVVNDANILLGRITIDDIVDVIREEADKDFQIASGITEKVESRDNVWILSRARLPWLLIGLLGGILGAQVIGLFESDILTHAELALFIPLIAAMGGNVGIQSSALIVQGLANGSLGMESVVKKLLKEIGVAFLNGIICSLVIFAYVIFAGHGMELAITVCVSLLSVIIVSGLFGTYIPLVLNKFKIDPALATGPFITTINDVFGLLIYFGIAAAIYL